MNQLEEAQKNAAPELKALASWVRNKSGMKVKSGILGGSRVEYFKGRSAMKALLSPAYAKLSTSKTSLHPKVTSDDEASLLLHPLISSGFFLRVERGGSITTPGPGGATAKVLAITPTQLFIPDDYYAWFYDADQTKMMLLAVGMVVVVLAAVMFPLWPAPLRIGVWYLSIAVLGLLGLLMAIAVFRLIFYVITIVVAKPGIWIFPELFADVGFFESFVPLYAWDIPVKKESRKSKSGGAKKSKKDQLSKSGTATPNTTGDESNAPKIVEIKE